MALFKLSIRPYRSASRPASKWVLNVFYASGKRNRFFFPTKEKAEEQVAIKRRETQEIGRRALDLSDKLRMEALDAQDRLKPFGVSLTEVVSEYIKRRGASSAVIDDLAQAYIDSREKCGKSQKHLVNLRCIFKRFVCSFSGRRAADITTEEIEAWCDGLGVGPASVNSYRTLLHSLFSYAERKRACPENPVKFMERRTVKAEKVGILTPEQLRELLEASSGDLLATVVIGAFAGIRPEEITRLTWEEIDLEEGLISIEAAKAKTAKQRYVKILPVLAAWLKPLAESGPVQRANFRRRFDIARLKAGFASRGNTAKAQGLLTWPHDALRHSFASYHLAMFEDTPALALQLGHQGTALIFQSYRHRVKKRDAEDYFNLLPFSNKQIPPQRKGDLLPSTNASKPPAMVSDRIPNSGAHLASGAM